MEQEQSGSQYSGRYGGLLGRVVLMILISIGSVGIAVPWAISLMYRWITSKVKLNGKQVVFSGSGKQLFPSWILVWLIGAVGLSVSVATGWSMFDPAVLHEHTAWDASSIPPAFILVSLLAGLSISATSVWFQLKSTRILTANTHFEGEQGKTSSFSSSYWQYLGKNIVFYLRLFITAGLGLPWALKHFMTWFTGETKIDETQLNYNAEPSFLKKWTPYWLIWWILWILQEVTNPDAKGWHEEYEEIPGALHAVNGLLEIGELFIQVWVYTAVLRWIFSRITKKD